jgi:hypothetical protein
MPEKNPCHLLECSPASLRPGNEEDKVEEDVAIAAAVNNANSLTFNNEQHANKDTVAVGGG